MAANPLAIFTQALGRFAPQEPFDVGKHTDQRALSQAQTANLTQDAAVNQAQAAGLAQQNTMRQRQIEDDAATREAIKNSMSQVPVTAPAPTLPPPPIDPATGRPVITPDYRAAQAGSAMQVPDLDVGAAALALMKQGRFDAANTLIKSHDAQVKTRNENTGKELENFTAQVNARKEALGGIFEAMYPDGPDKPRSAAGVARAAQLWEANRENLLKLGMNPAVVNAPFDPDRAEAQYRSLAGAEGITSSIKSHLGLKQTEAQIEAEKATAEHARAAAKLAGVQAEAGQIDLDWLKKQNDAAMAGGPEDLKRTVAGFIDPRKYPDLYNRTVAEYAAVITAAKPSERRTAALTVLTKAKDKVDSLEADIAKETNPDILAARKKNAIDTEVGKEVARANASPDAFGGILDTRSRTAAQTQYEKDSKEYADKVGAAQQFGDLVKMAQAGNKNAPGLIPIAEVRGFVNRVNRQELDAVSKGAGSAYDRLVGKINGLKDGQPIPPDVMRDMAAVSEAQQRAARRTYEYKVQVTNRTYGAKATPIDLQGAPAATPTHNDPLGIR